MTGSGCVPRSRHTAGSVSPPVEQSITATHHGEVTQPLPERDAEPVDEADDIEAWRDLQDVLEERDREYWAGTYADDESE